MKKEDIKEIATLMANAEMLSANPNESSVVFSVYYDKAEAKLLKALANDENEPSLSGRYPMLFVCKDDLVTMGFNVSDVTNETMTELAEAMADCYSDDEFHSHLNECARDVDIPFDILGAIEHLMENGSTRYVAEEYVTDFWDWDISKDDNLEKFLVQMKELGVEIDN